MGRFLLFLIGLSASALFFDDLDYLRRADLPIAAYSMAGNVIECCEQTPLGLRRGPDGMSSRVVPFFQFDVMAFKRYGAKQLGRSCGACCSIADGNRHFKRVTAVARCIFTTPTINSNAVLFQNHGLILTLSNCLPMPACGRQGPHASTSDPTAGGRTHRKSENLATFPGFHSLKEIFQNNQPAR